MTRVFPDGEAILVTQDRWQRPLRFLWRGRHHQVAAVHQSWEIDTDWWSEEGRVWRTYHALTTTGSLLCVICQDHLAQRWHLVKLYD